MIQDGELIRVAPGVYVRARTVISSITKQPTIATTAVPEVWAWQILQKLGVDPQPNTALRNYNEGRSTQIPVWLVFDVGRSRIRRKIVPGKWELIYERT